MDETNPYAFINSDVIVWNGVISQYGSVKHLIQKEDNMRKATEAEEDEYELKNK